MKHAGTAVLDQLEPLLGRIRAAGVLREKSRGIFYLKSRAYLHFHEDPAGIFVDIRALDGRDLRPDQARSVGRGRDPGPDRLGRRRLTTAGTHSQRFILNVAARPSAYFEELFRASFPLDRSPVRGDPGHSRAYRRRPIVKDGVEITILSVGPPAGGPGGVVEVILDAEARSDAAADKLKFRSLRGVTAVDCRLGANRFIKADAYPEADLRARSRREWSAGTGSSRRIVRSCRG
ncbi:MAG: hypothetical protein WDM85_01575 [Caulobacteraceae bacterium]